jgi:hypothetical protein
VILLNIDSLTNDFHFINKMVSAMTIDGEISILALSDERKNIKNKNYFEGNFAEVRTQLDKILPEHKRAAATVA